MVQPNGISKIDKKVYLGYDVFKESYVDLGNIKNVGVVINHTSSIVSIDNNTNTIISNISSENLKIRVFFAPNHTFDNNTLLALKECGITEIIDGYGLMPYEENNIKFIPQLFYKKS
mgnify:CR=1 FL=1